MDFICPNCNSHKVKQIGDTFKCVVCEGKFTEIQLLAYKKNIDKRTEFYFNLIGIPYFATDDVVKEDKETIKNQIQYVEESIISKAKTEKEKEDLKDVLNELLDALVRKGSLRPIEIPIPLSNISNNSDLIKALLNNPNKNPIYTAAAKLRSSVERKLKDDYGFVSVGKEKKVSLPKKEYLLLFKKCYPQRKITIDDIPVIKEYGDPTEYVSLNNVLKFYKVSNNKLIAERAAEYIRTLNLFIHESSDNDNELLTKFANLDGMRDYLLEALSFFKKNNLFAEE